MYRRLLLERHKRVLKARSHRDFSGCLKQLCLRFAGACIMVPHVIQWGRSHQAFSGLDVSGRLSMLQHKMHQKKPWKDNRLFLTPENATHVNKIVPVALSHYFVYYFTFNNCCLERPTKNTEQKCCGSFFRGSENACRFRQPERVLWERALNPYPIPHLQFITFKACSHGSIYFSCVVQLTMKKPPKAHPASKPQATII